MIDFHGIPHYRQKRNFTQGNLTQCSANGEAASTAQAE
jgi:hypothetical protein